MSLATASDVEMKMGSLIGADVDRLELEADIDQLREELLACNMVMVELASENQVLKLEIARLKVKNEELRMKN